MKQATNPFAPVPLWRKRLPGYAAMGVATIAVAVGLIAIQNARTTVAGEPKKAFKAMYRLL